MESKSLVIDKKWDDVAKSINEYKQLNKSTLKCKKQLITSIAAILEKSIKNPNDEFISALNATNDTFGFINSVNGWEICDKNKQYYTKLRIYVTYSVKQHYTIKKNSKNYIKILESIFKKIPIAKNSHINNFTMFTERCISITIRLGSEDDPDEMGYVDSDSDN